MHQPGFTGPQGFNTAAVATFRSTMVFQRIGRVTFAVADCTLAEDDADELTVGACANNGHFVIANYAITLIGGELRVIISVADKVNELLLTGLRIDEAV